MYKRQAEENGMENKESEEIGAIVANCNPFTKGHRYLVEYAASRCKYLHLFILSEEQEFISSDARFHMVSEGVKDLKNVILHRTSDYLCLLYTSPSPRDGLLSRMPSSA